MASFRCFLHAGNTYPHQNWSRSEKSALPPALLQRERITRFTSPHHRSRHWLEECYTFGRIASSRIADWQIWWSAGAYVTGVEWGFHTPGISEEAKTAWCCHHIKWLSLHSFCRHLCSQSHSRIIIVTTVTEGFTLVLFVGPKPQSTLSTFEHLGSKIVSSTEMSQPSTVSAYS